MERLLQYPHHTAGGIMTTEFVRLDPTMTVGDALKHIRSVAREKESIYACYVLEPETGRLLGSVSLRDLVMAELAKPVTEVMRKKPITVDALDDQEAVAKKIAKYNLLAVPGPGEGRQRGGLRDRGRRHRRPHRGADGGRPEDGGHRGRAPSTSPTSRTPIPLVVRKRIGWLLLLFVAETFTGTVLRHYEGELAAVVALSFFIPLLIGTGGNAGSQTVTTIIRSLALGEIRLKDAWRVLAREATTGITIGLLIGAIAFGRALLWGAHMPLAWTVALTVLAICTWSTTVGSLIPIAAERFGVDSAVLSAPLITTLVDATGLVIYFRIAKVILGL